MKTDIYQTIVDVKNGLISPEKAYVSIFSYLTSSPVLSPSQRELFVSVLRDGVIHTECKREWNKCHMLEKKGLLRQDTYDYTIFYANDYHNFIKYTPNYLIT